MTGRTLRITGRVQGVGFRYAMQAEAARLGVTGWVRNRRDGSVEALLAGAPGAVEALTAWARSGPPGAHVRHVEMEQTSLDEPSTGFQLLPTL